MANLKLGNVYNKVTAPGGNFAQEQASATNMANVLALAAKGVDTSPQASGFQQTLGAALQGASLGFTNKANSKAAEAQDAYNQWAMEIQKHEEALAARDAAEAQEQQAIKKAAIPAVVAMTQYKQNGDKAAYEARLRTIADSYATDTGVQLVNAHLSPDNDQKLVVTVKDESGEQDTQTLDLANLVGMASEINKDIGTAGMEALGFSPPAAANPTQSKIDEAKAILGRDLTEEEKLSVAGIKVGKAEKAQPDEYQKQYAKDQAKADSEFINKTLPTIQPAIFAADKIIDTLATTGVQTGPTAELKAQVLGTVNTLLGNTLFSNPSEIESIKSLTGPQVFAAVKNLGAGTGISNADREFASQIAGGALNTPEALVKMQSIIKASSVRNGNWARVIQDFQQGKITADEKERLRTAIFGDASGSGQLDKFSYKNLATRFEAEYMGKLNQSKQTRLMPNNTAQAPSGAATTVVAPNKQDVIKSFNLNMGQ